jgi:hypothetical protein
MSQTLIFIPSYFDYVRIRNYFVREDLEFAQINEYVQGPFTYVVVLDTGLPTSSGLWFNPLAWSVEHWT